MTERELIQALTEELDSYYVWCATDPNTDLILSHARDYLNRWGDDE